MRLPLRTKENPVELPYQSAHEELHFVNRAGWLRAAVLGANDGIVSVSSLIVGVAAADPNPSAILLAGGAGLAAGAMSMAAGEYVSVSSQSDIERADIEREQQALLDTPEEEEAELASIYEARGLSKSTAALVARELTEKDALGAHVRDELGLSEVHTANPLQAALASGVTFSIAAAIPVVAAVLAPETQVIPTVVGTTLVSLAALGAIGARAGAAPLLPATLRVLFWGAAAMAITAGVGHLFGVNV
ncbi:VIT1/CCC1 transporter family protein [Thalassovita mangrovi]|uniref:VIT family protein n=1 Tax=Thalassovita mangrovi TaxID=2692236 RepID=A0A6L8LIY8_9RHOB|nr:VIT family protein [Thalassovita mangrovi]MYM54430.1 VIT family protein [Thalassovita mangrovi]